MWTSTATLRAATEGTALAITLVSSALADTGDTALVTIIGMAVAVVLAVTADLEVALRVILDDIVVLLATVNDIVQVLHLTSMEAAASRVTAGKSHGIFPWIQEETAPVNVTNLSTKFRKSNEEVSPEKTMGVTNLKASECVQVRANVTEQTQKSTIQRERFPWKMMTRVTGRLSSEENAASTAEGHI